MENDQELYYAHRNRINAPAGTGKADTAEAAGLFYYLNRIGYNGLCRFNRSGEYNVPFGSYGKINYTRNFYLTVNYSEAGLSNRLISGLYSWSQTILFMPIHPTM